MGGAGGGDDGYLARSDELKSFHETLSRLQQIEDQVIDEHREIIQVGVALWVWLMGVVCCRNIVTLLILKKLY